MQQGNVITTATTNTTTRRRAIEKRSRILFMRHRVRKAEQNRTEIPYIVDNIEHVSPWGLGPCQVCLKNLDVGIQ